MPEPSPDINQTIDTLSNAETICNLFARGSVESDSQAWTVFDFTPNLLANNFCDNPAASLAAFCSL